MKKYALILIVMISTFSFGQEDSDLIKFLKKTLIKDAITTIIVGDSIIQNTSLSKIEIAEIKYFQGLAYQNNKNHKKALVYFDEILPIFQNKTNKKMYVFTLLGQSNANVYLKKHTIATTQAMHAREVASKNNITSLVASANAALSFIYYSNGKYLKALEYLKGTVTIFVKEGRDQELSAIYNNMAIIHKKISAFDKAISYNEKSLKLSVKNKHYLGIGKSYSNIGQIYRTIGEYEKAFYFYNKAIDNNLKHSISNSYPYENIGEFFLETGDFVQAEESYKKALNIELKNENDIKIKDIYKGLLKIAINIKSYKKAYNYQNRIEIITERIKSAENKEKIKMIGNQHLLFQKQQELEQVNRKTKNQLILFTTLIFVLLFFFLFLFQRNKNKKLQNEKEKVVLEQRVLRAQMNPHFIFNALSAIQNSLLDNEPIESASYLSRFAKLIRQNFDFINEKTILLADEIDALQNYLDTQKMRFKDKFDYEINIDKSIDIYTVHIPPILIQPFVENSIEHGFKNKKEKGKIGITISIKNKQICYEIKDNGKGFEKDKIQKEIHAIDIFKKRLKLRGNDEVKTFKISSSEKGTIINFCLTQ